MRRGRAVALACCVWLSAAAAAPVPEPQGYWTGPIHGPVAATLAGGSVIHTRKLAALLKRGAVLVVDVSDAPRRPANLAQQAPWLPLPHPVIPGAIWIPGAGGGSIPADVDQFFRARLALASGNDLSQPLVIYCHEQCWLSWNAAKRAISYGYRRVYWFPDGMEGWRAAGLATEVAQPQTPP
jgi:PQQ-dependent catabolism-associated CXXCW motif protein